jgi:hypothetical protein
LLQKISIFVQDRFVFALRALLCFALLCFALLCFALFVAVIADECCCSTVFQSFAIEILP